MPTRRERRLAAAAAAEPSPPIEPFFMRLIGAPVVRKMLGIPFGKMGQCASPAKSARHARYPVSPVAAINAWAHMAGYLHESVSVVDVGGRGLGLVAAKAGVAAGEALVSMPLSACVTHDLAMATPAVAELLSILPPDELEPHVSMAVWLMHARVHQPLQLRPWLAALPSQFDCTLEWSDDELAALQASRATARARALRGWASALYGKLFFAPTAPLSTVPANASVSGNFEPSEARFHWALCAVWSRSFQLPCAADGTVGGSGASSSGAPARGCRDGLWRVLPPVVDLMNAPAVGDSASARYAIAVAGDGAVGGAAGGATGGAAGDAAGGAASGGGGAAAAAAADGQVLRVFAQRDLAPGESIELDYGPRPNSELITTHGFALRGSPHDHLPLELAPEDSDPLGAVKRKILAAGNLSAPYALSVRALRTDSDLLVALRLLVADADELRGYAAAFRGEALSGRNEERWRELLLRQAEALLEVHERTSTAAQDEDTMHRADEAAAAAAVAAAEGGVASGGGAAVSGRAWAALVTRHGEKRLLHAVADELRGDPSGRPVEASSP